MSSTRASQSRMRQTSSATQGTWRMPRRSPAGGRASAGLLSYPAVSYVVICCVRCAVMCCACHAVLCCASATPDCLPGWPLFPGACSEAMVEREDVSAPLSECPNQCSKNG